MYEHFLKRLFDFLLSLLALVILSPLLIVLTILGALIMKGNPFFVQPRPGRRKKLPDGTYGPERIFKLIKFRSMTCEKDDEGRLLPDEKRLTGYGRFIRSTSLDELPELLNILVGDMAIVGPRPQLVRDMVFMSQEQRNRHNVRQGMTGLAQINGRNCILWDDKLSYDVQYVSDISFLGDLKIIFKTIGLVFNREGVSSEGMATAEDYGDWLLREGRISRTWYEEKQEEASRLLSNSENI